MAQYIGVNGVARKVTSPYIGVDGVARNVKNGYVGVDGVARLFFAPEDGSPVILEVEKIVSDTYANSTKYTAEEFILLDIYPKTGGTVNVTYGGLTKTITDTSGAEEPNAQQVFFGTFNGVSDSVATPSSGELTIEGDYYAFGGTSFQNTQKNLFPGAFNGFVKVVSFGDITEIPKDAFGSVLDTKDTIFPELPTSITSICEQGFYKCAKVSYSEFPANLTSIGSSAFGFCTSIPSVHIHKNVSHIGENPWNGVSEDRLNITVDSENGYYKNDGNCLVEINTDTVIAGFSDSIIPRYTKKIGGCAFYTIKNLSIDSIPEGVETIERTAFFGAIFTSASITIPASVTKIGSEAFRGGCNIENIVFLSTTPPEISPSSFDDDDDTSLKTITVPKGCGEAYKAAENWRSFADYIVEAT